MDWIPFALGFVLGFLTFPIVFCVFLLKTEDHDWWREDD